MKMKWCEYCPRVLYDEYKHFVSFTTGGNVYKVEKESVTEVSGLSFSISFANASDNSCMSWSLWCQDNICKFVNLLLCSPRSQCEAIVNAADFKKWQWPLYKNELFPIQEFFSFLRDAKVHWFHAFLIVVPLGVEPKFRGSLIWSWMSSCQIQNRIPLKL